MVERGVRGVVEGDAGVEVDILHTLHRPNVSDVLVKHHVVERKPPGLRQKGPVRPERGYFEGVKGWIDSSGSPQSTH